MKLAHTMIRVKDLEATLDFYENFIGLEEQRRKSIGDEATPYRPGSGFADFLAGLPAVLGAADLRAAIAATAKAHARERTILWGFGAHLIKVGLAPIVVDLLDRGLASGLFTNGAGCVHDPESPCAPGDPAHPARTGRRDPAARHA